VMAHTGDSSLTQPGVPRGFRRTGLMRTQTMPAYLRFDPVMTRTIPRAWLIPASDTAAIALLKLHGVRVESPAGNTAMITRRGQAHVERPATPMSTARVSQFVIDSMASEPKAFQGHHEMRVTGSWRDTTMLIPGDMVTVRGDQLQAVAALYLLDPESDDGLVTWNVFDPELAPGKPFPVWRVLSASNASP
jgi:hypothetical protein